MKIRSLLMALALVFGLATAAPHAFAACAPLDPDAKAKLLVQLADRDIKNRFAFLETSRKDGPNAFILVVAPGYITVNTSMSLTSSVITPTDAIDRWCVVGIIPKGDPRHGAAAEWWVEHELR